MLKDRTPLPTTLKFMVRDSNGNFRNSKCPPYVPIPVSLSRRTEAVWTTYCEPLHAHLSLNQHLHDTSNRSGTSFYVCFQALEHLTLCSDPVARTPGLAGRRRSFPRRSKTQ
ncbi:hypothetical protein, variant [Blastomyces dermatitidis ER-3]|uniref:Uncharacterized protein n=2 Tax=Blastomyces TaxID=229219 RepID=A0A179UC40_BLAGS|nr:uncharacterized protein BDBG_16485 [Blastomyces gilchristii SLH14081]XP_031576784.1 hypothetical protein, variant [Blastomyces gilchristii SLH14081]XP_045280529.1 uncharacterized protein BDCG_16762 [Blastomyces dermatitidis ER-3]XP_045280530.1 hypothetical protein, variant [Blastomyces dermatitidis ER-3]EQL38568.1 hypothetical protein BDFG_00143 [Blastomyces dermatitidis ATCC 26199]OAT00802.1 hypothetical protein BDCG_16762 [Blastomyces dermatitidis ER-3]OAT00803.1 hypothetical protein, va